MANAPMKRLVSLMRRVEGEQPPRESETPAAYFKRLQETAIEIQRKERARKRKAARAARKRNR